MAVLSTILEAASALAVRAAESDKFARDSAVMISQEAVAVYFLGNKNKTTELLVTLGAVLKVNNLIRLL